MPKHQDSSSDNPFTIAASVLETKKGGHGGELSTEPDSGIMKGAAEQKNQ